MLSTDRVHVRKTSHPFGTGIIWFVTHRCGHFSYYPTWDIAMIFADRHSQICNIPGRH